MAGDLIGLFRVGLGDFPALPLCSEIVPGNWNCALQIVFLWFLAWRYRTKTYKTTMSWNRSPEENCSKFDFGGVNVSV